MTMHSSGDESRFPGCVSLGDAADFLDTVSEIIDDIPLFEGFERGDLIGLIRHMRCYRAPAGREIISEDDPGEFMLLLLEGNIEIVRRSKKGELQRIGVAKPGETLGEMSLVDGEPRFASCLAIDTATFAVIDRDGLNNIFEDEPHLGIKFLSGLLCLLNRRLRDTGKQLVEALMRQN